MTNTLMEKKYFALFQFWDLQDNFFYSALAYLEQKLTVRRNCLKSYTL